MQTTLPARYTEKGNGAFYEKSGGFLLAQMPALAQPERPVIDPVWEDYYAHFEGQLTQKRAYRWSWWSHWALLAQFILPRRYHYLITANTMNRGRQLNQDIVDSTGTLAMRTCAAGMMSGLTSPNRPWFRLRSAVPNFEPDHAAQMWFEDVAERLRFVHAESNFYDSLATMYEDLVTFGTSPVIDYEDEDDVIRCYNPCAGEYFCGVGFDFRQEQLYREFTLTNSQIVEMFDLKNCPIEVQEAWAEKGASLDQERVVCHSIEPNYAIRGRNGQSARILDGKWPWREVYWLRGIQGFRPLSVRGFYDKPWVAPRWATVSNDPYGRSPGMDALPDIMQLQVETKRKAEALEKVVRPPMLASATLKNEPSSILPGHITYVQTMGPGEGMRPAYEVRPDLAAMTQDIQAIQARIAEAFYNDLFKMIASLDSVERRTATEIDARREEKLVLLGPVIERLQNEGLSPRIRRHVGIMDRRGLLPPVPPSLRGVPVQIEYVSMLTIAQRAAATAGIERTYAFAGSMAAIYPEVRDNLNPDETIRYYGDLMGNPERVFTDRRQMALIRQQREQEAQEQQAAQLTAAGVQGAQVLSQTPVGAGNTALDLMLGTGPAQ